MSSIRTRGRTLLAVGLGLLASAAIAGTAVAALQGDEESNRGQLLIGRDDDAPTDPTIQPAGVAANQSLRKGDQLFGGRRSDLLIGRLGPDVLVSGPGDRNDGGDVIVGGTERGSDVAAFPNFDVAKGGSGSDAFVWAPGDGSDAFIGGEPSRGRPDTDTLVIGTMPLQPGDNSQPALFETPFGPLPRAIVSNGKLPATIGDSPALASIKSSCQVVDAPAGLGYQHLVRVFNAATGAQAVTIRIKQVEQLLCGSSEGDGIVRTTFGRDGGGEPVVRTTDFEPRPGTKLDALVD
jgi:hypothetical protein